MMTNIDLGRQGLDGSLDEDAFAPNSIPAAALQVGDVDVPEGFVKIDANGAVVISGSGVPAADTSSVLDLISTTKGFLPPRMTTTERLAIVTPVAGLIVWDITLAATYTYNGTAWLVTITTATDGPTFVDQETPAGAQDGSNPTFALSVPPAIGSVHFYRNGMLQRAGGNDYVILGQNLTLISPPQADDVLLASYRVG